MLMSLLLLMLAGFVGVYGVCYTAGASCDTKRPLWERFLCTLAALSLILLTHGVTLIILQSIPE